MSEQPVFTPGREKDSDALARFGITDEEERRRAEAYERYYGLRKARERDRDGRTRLVLRWKLMDDFDMDHFERYGRHVVRVLTMDAYLSHAGLDGRVLRGGAVNLKPDEECRAFLRRFKEVQAAREALYDGDDDDVPLRAVLGGEQVFTPWRENEEDRDWDGYVRELKKETHKRPKGYAAWRPQKKTTRLVMQVKDVLEEYRNYLPMTARQIFYRLVGAHDYPKTEAAYKTLCEHLVRARRAKMIPFDHIRDDGISMAAHSHYADENAFYKRVHDMGKAYKRDKLARQGLDIRVYCEAAGMIPQLNRVCLAVGMRTPVYVWLESVRRILYHRQSRRPENRLSSGPSTKTPPSVTSGCRRIIPDDPPSQPVGAGSLDRGKAESSEADSLFTVSFTNNTQTSERRLER